MPRLTNTELERRVAALEAENAALRSQRDENIVTEPLPDAAVVESKRTRGWGWTLFAAVLIVIGAVLAPVAVVASWAKVQLTDTETFVATYAPLAKDPGVQQYVTDEAVKVIQDSVDIPQLTSQVIDGITGLGTGAVATQALEMLKAPLAQGIVSLIQTTVGRFVSSDAFAQVWQETLRVSHSQLVATMQGHPDAAIAIGSDGSVGIQLGPIIDRAKQLLEDQGMTFASSIPTINKTITVAENSSIPTLQLFYGVAVAAGAWLPWVSIGLLALGVIVARRRSLALIGAASALGIAMIVVVSAISIGQLVFVASVSPGLVPAGVAQTLYATVSTAMKDTGVAVLVLAIVVSLVAWYSGPFSVPRRLRGFFASGVTWVRDSAERHGISTGRTGEWFYAQRVLLRSAVAVVATVVLLFVRPLSPGLIVWTLVVAVVGVAILELVQRPVSTTPLNDDDDTPVMIVS